MNYTKAKVEIVNFNNDDVITASLGKHPLCGNQISWDRGCWANHAITFDEHRCITTEYN